MIIITYIKLYVVCISTSYFSPLSQKLFEENQGMIIYLFVILGFIWELFLYCKLMQAWLQQCIKIPYPWVEM